MFFKHISSFFKIIPFKLESYVKTNTAIIIDTFAIDYENVERTALFPARIIASNYICINRFKFIEITINDKIEKHYLKRYVAMGKYFKIFNKDYKKMFSTKWDAFML